MSKTIIKKTDFDLFVNEISLLDGVYSQPSECNVLLDISFPIIFSFRVRNFLFLCYTLRYRRGKAMSLLISPTEYNTLYSLVSGSLGIQEALGENLLYIQRKNCSDDFALRHVSYKRIYSFLPEKNYYLTDNIPNKSDLSYLKNYYLNKRNESEKFFDEYFILDSKQDNKIRKLIRKIS